MIDVPRAPAIRGATFVVLEQITGSIDGIEKTEPLLLVCTKGRRAYLLQNKLRSYGYTDTVVLEGSTFVNEVKAQSHAVSPEDAP